MVGQDVCVTGEHPAVEPLMPGDRVFFPELLVTRERVGDGSGVNGGRVAEGGDVLLVRHSFLQTSGKTMRQPAGDNSNGIGVYSSPHPKPISSMNPCPNRP